MRILIVEADAGLAGVWSRHLERLGCKVERAATQGEAVAALQHQPVDVIVLDLTLEQGSAFAVADFASYRQPAARVIFVTRSSFFSDGSIFNLVPNACGFFAAETPPEDLAVIVRHYAD
jgi:DNA-binding response OmpR family regulator